jgi:hypothetical protein
LSPERLITVPVKTFLLFLLTILFRVISLPTCA